MSKEFPTNPALIAIGGLSGSGKTTLARAIPTLFPDYSFVNFRPDEIRHELRAAGTIDYDYSLENSDRVYKEMIMRAGKALAAGQNVILDAVFAQEWERAAVQELARENKAHFHAAWLEAPIDVLIARVIARQEKLDPDNASEADADIVKWQHGWALGEVTWPVLNTTGAINDAIDRLLRIFTPK